MGAIAPIFNLAHNMHFQILSEPIQAFKMRALRPYGFIYYI
jgi:hypothetical protein